MRERETKEEKWGEERYWESREEKGNERERDWHIVREKKVR